MDPVKLCCMRPVSEHRGVVCPDGRVACSVCFRRTPLDLLWRDPDDGQRVDVCIQCKADEAQRAGLVHRVLVRDAFDPDDPRASLVLIHDPRCPTLDGEYVCHERYEDTESGLDLYFLHANDTDTSPYSQTRVVPGIYEVRAWSRKHDVPGEPVEWDGGIEILDTPRAPHPSLPLAEPHQLWIWLAGATPPHWEVRGTGVRP